MVALRQGCLLGGFLLLCTAQLSSTCLTRQQASTRVDEMRDVLINMLTKSMDCNLPYEQGPCNQGLTRYYYDRSTRQCRTFRYGGCAGNSNNFMDEGSCISACGTGTTNLIVCSPRDRLTGFNCGPGYQNCPTGYKCLNDIIGGTSPGVCCADTQSNCPAKSVCSLPPRSTGVSQLCIKLLTATRYYYSRAAGRCFQYTYEGCPDTPGNRFVSDAECMRCCQGQ